VEARARRRRGARDPDAVHDAALRLPREPGRRGAARDGRPARPLHRVQPAGAAAARDRRGSLPRARGDRVPDPALLVGRAAARRVGARARGGGALHHVLWRALRARDRLLPARGLAALRRRARARGRRPRALVLAVLCRRSRLAIFGGVVVLVGDVAARSSPAIRADRPVGRTATLAPEGGCSCAASTGARRRECRRGRSSDRVEGMRLRVRRAGAESGGRER
jgi:hypothetical protein